MCVAERNPPTHPPSLLPSTHPYLTHPLQKDKHWTAKCTLSGSQVATLLYM